MPDKSMIFSAPMVLALRAGTKTQHRTPIKWQGPRGVDYSFANAWLDNPAGVPRLCVPYKIPEDIDDLWDECRAYRHHGRVNSGERIWVREAWGPWDGDQSAAYRADGGEMPTGGWRSPIHMPRRFSRITLTATDVRVMRVQDINRGDAMGEGCPFANMADGPDPREWYAALWNSIHGPDAWGRNDWVEALTFAVRKRNIDHE